VGKNNSAESISWRISRIGWPIGLCPGRSSIITAIEWLAIPCRDIRAKCLHLSGNKEERHQPTALCQIHRLKTHSEVSRQIFNPLRAWDSLRLSEKALPQWESTFPEVCETASRCTGFISISLFRKFKNRPSRGHPPRWLQGCNYPLNIPLFLGKPFLIPVLLRNPSGDLSGEDFTFPQTNDLLGHLFPWVSHLFPRDYLTDDLPPRRKSDRSLPPDSSWTTSAPNPTEMRSCQVITHDEDCHVHDHVA